MCRLVAMLWPMFLASLALAQPADRPEKKSMKSVEHLKDFPVIELRRYTIKPGERKHFAQYFESYFPEAFQQLGSIIFGHFFERDNPSTFTWMRGFHDMDARATVNQAFYFGPLWKDTEPR